jgi:hypothetical protein
VAFFSFLKIGTPELTWRRLAGKLDRVWIDGEIAPLYSTQGRPGIETRFVIGLVLLKHICGLSDEAVCDRWVSRPLLPVLHRDFSSHFS